MVTVQFIQSAAFDPADSTQYFLGSDGQQPTTGSFSTQQTPRLPLAGIVVAVTARVLVTGVLGSAELVAMEIFEDTNNLNEAIDQAAATAWNGSSVNYLDQSMSLAIDVQTRWGLRFTTPAWVTNPTQVRIQAIAYVNDNAEVAATAAQDSGISDNLASILTNDSDLSARLVSILANDSDISAILAGDTTLLQGARFAGVLTADEMAALRSALRLQVADTATLLKGRSVVVPQYP